MPWRWNCRWELYVHLYEESTVILLPCSNKTNKPNKTKTLSVSVSHGVSASHTSSFPAAGGWGSPSDDLMRPPLISISQLACCSAWLKTREGIADFFFFFFSIRLSSREVIRQPQTEMQMNACHSETALDTVWWVFCLGYLKTCSVSLSLFIFPVWNGSVSAHQPVCQTPSFRPFHGNEFDKTLRLNCTFLKLIYCN